MQLKTTQQALYHMHRFMYLGIYKSFVNLSIHFDILVLASVDSKSIGPFIKYVSLCRAVK